MLRLALPVLVEQVLVMLVGLCDTWLTGRFLGREHLAAMNLMSYTLWLLPALFAAVGIGATAMIARFVGAGDWDSAGRVTNQAFVVGALLAVIATVAGLLFGDSLVGVMRLEGEAALLASRYLKIVLAVFPAMMLEVVGTACLRGAGRMMAGLAVMALVNVVNVSVGAALLVGLGPLPKLGWDGLAYGVAAGYVVGALAMLGLFISGRAGLRLEGRWLWLDAGLARRILRIGLPGGLDVLSIIACHLWFVGIINQLGEVAAAAHGVAIRIESLAYLPGAAFQVAAATLVGQYLGARDPGRATQSVITACLVGGGFMVSAGILFYMFAAPLTEMFLGGRQPEVALTAAPLLRIVALAMPALALLSIISGALRGAGDTRWPFVISFVGLLGVRIPGAYFLAHACGLGVRGAWYAMAADLALRCILISGRFFHGGWKRIEV